MVSLGQGASVLTGLRLASLETSMRCVARLVGRWVARGKRRGQYMVFRDGRAACGLVMTDMSVAAAGLGEAEFARGGCSRTGWRGRLPRSLRCRQGKRER